MSSLNLIFGDPNKKLLGELRADVDKINGLETSIQTLTDEALKEKLRSFVSVLLQENRWMSVVTFAVVRETARRVLNQRHFDVQLMGGIIASRSHRGDAHRRRQTPLQPHRFI